VPAKKVKQDGSDSKIQYVVRRRCSTLDEQGKDYDLKCIRNDRQDQCDSKARTR